MIVNFEYVNPFDDKYDYFMRIEHLGRYFFSSDILKNFNNVLDVACADGYGTKILSKNVTKVVGIDRNKEYLSIAREKYNSDNIEYKCMDFDKETILGIYDGIVCFETLEHLRNPEKFLNNLYDVLDKNGIMLLSIPNSNYEKIENDKNKDPFHIHIFEYNDIIQLIKNTGFNIEKVYGQSYTNKIVNNEIKEYRTTNLINDANTIAYPNEDDINKTYSYIFLLSK